MTRRGAHGGDAPPGPLEATPGGPGEPRVWGWGPERGRPQLSPAVAEMLRRVLGAQGAPPPVALEDVRLPDPTLSPAARERLAAAVGNDHVSDGHRERIAHAGGKSYEDVLRLRAGDASGAPDAVVRPGTHDEVAGVLTACAEHGVAVVPFGGGTSVVGGVDPDRGGHAAVISLDLSRLDRLVSVDRRSLTATFEAGVAGRAAEALLDSSGLTLGHFPQSFEYATLGGYLATRSAGQASTGYGRIEDLVLGLRCATPEGELHVDPMPASAAGPSLLGLVVGSEGVFGVITEATLTVRVRPERRRYEGWAFPSFAGGAEAFRRLAQAGAAPDVARLSDEEETRLALAQAGAGGALAPRALRRYLRLRGHRTPCLVVVGWEGPEKEVARRRSRSAGILREAGGIALGERPGRAWAQSRFEGPYLRDDLLALGILAETLETATTWDRVERLHAAVAGALHEALGARNTPPLVSCHISHLYRAGASLYFTVLARQARGAEVEQWHAAKRAAGDAIAREGGTTTHHHAVGRAHRPWIAGELGELGIEALRAVKARLDPSGIMNPGKLLP